MRKKFALLARFVVDADGKKIGESISFYEDMLIIKKGKDYCAIPLKHVELKDGKIHIKGIVAWDKAKELAKGWLKNV